MNKIITFLATAFVLLSCSSVPKQGPTTRFTGVFPDGPIPDSVEIQYWIPTDTVLLVKTKMVPVVDRRFEGESREKFPAVSRNSQKCSFLEIS